VSASAVLILPDIDGDGALHKVIALPDGLTGGDEVSVAVKFGRVGGAKVDGDGAIVCSCEESSKRSAEDGSDEGGCNEELHSEELLVKRL
jgi:hypothetical protein